MKSKNYRQLIWRRRFIVAIVSASAGILLAQCSNTFTENPGTKMLQTASRESSKELPSPEVNKDWLGIVQQLDDQRALAISRRDESELANIYAQNSTLSDNDRTLIKNLISQDAKVENLTFQVLDLQMISHRWSEKEEVVELLVTDKRSSYFLLDNGIRTEVPERKVQRWFVSIYEVNGKWLIGNVEIYSDNR